MRLQEIAAALPGYEPDSLSMDCAREFITSALPPPSPARETLPLQALLGRVLAEDLVSGIDVPAHDNSAMDGYAFSGAELRSGQATRLHIAGTSLAGCSPPASASAS